MFLRNFGHITLVSISTLILISCSSSKKASKQPVVITQSQPGTTGTTGDLTGNGSGSGTSVSATPVTATTVTNNNSTSTEWNPFNTPTGANQSELTTFTVNGVSYIAWGQQRCASVGDSLPIWGGGSTPVAGTHKGRVDWSDLYATQYAEYLRRAKDAVDLNGNSLPLYPAYGVIGANGVITLPSGPAPSNPASTVRALPSGYQLFAFCVPSCFRGDQIITFANEQERQKYLKMQDAEKLFSSAPRSFQVATLDPASDKGSLKTAFSNIGTFVSDMKVANPVPQMFYEFITEMNHSLTVTDNHGMLLSSGELRTAKDLSDKLDNGKIESLLNVSGQSEKIVKINKLSLPERSFNMRVENKSGEAAGHIVVSQEGLLSADAHLQDQLGAMNNNINESLDRENIPLEVLPK